MAVPAKALCDYIYVRRLRWSIADAMDSLRIDEDVILKTKRPDLLPLYGNYRNRRVKEFLSSWINFVKSKKS